MATIYKKMKVNASVDHVWNKVSDVGGISNLMNVLSESHVEGDKRVCTTQDGGKIEEQIISVDNNLKRVSYTITNSPFGLDFHTSSWHVTPEGNGSLVKWFTDVKPDSAAGMLNEVLDGELENITKGLGNK
jgi:hypothetical protein